MGFVYLDKILVIPSPVAIFRGTPNLSAAKKFVDFLLSKEGQAIVAASCTLPIRKDVPIVQGVGLVPPDEAVKRAFPLDYVKMIGKKESIAEKFTAIMTK